MLLLRTKKSIDSQWKGSPMGAYVRNPEPGLFKTVYITDFSGLYPSILRTFNIAPETLVGKIRYEDVKDFLIKVDKKYEFTIFEPEKRTVQYSLNELKEKMKGNIFTLSGCFFQNPHKHRSLFFDVLTHLIETRKIYKKRMKEDANNYTTYNNYQRSVKENTNSVYGVLGFNSFRFFNPDLVNSVTFTGRFMIKFSSILYSQMIVNKTKTLSHDQIRSAVRRLLDMYLDGDVKEPYVLYSDTDSVDGNTITESDFGIMSIAELFDKAPGQAFEDGYKSYRKTLYLSIYAKSFDTTLRKVEEAEIKYIRKHYVKKRMYRIVPKNRPNKGILMTLDHSLMVLRGTIIVPTKPEDVRHGDRLIVVTGNTYKTELFEVQDFGVQERWVYDMEMDNDSHTFVGNDILVHNSVFLDISDKVDKDFMDEATNFVNNKSFKVLGDEYLGYDDCYMALDYKGLYKAYFTNTKKKYALYNLESKKLEITGLEIIRSDYPKITRERLKRILKMVLLENRSLQDILQQVEVYRKDMVNRIKKLDPSVGRPMPYNKALRSYKKVPSHVFAMELWNRLVSPSFRIGSKGYSYKASIQTDKLSEKQKIILQQLMEETGRKSPVTTIVIPQDFKGTIPDFVTIKVENNLAFVWNDRVSYLLSGLVSVKKDEAIPFDI